MRLYNVAAVIAAACISTASSLVLSSLNDGRLQSAVSAAGEQRYETCKATGRCARGAHIVDGPSIRTIYTSYTYQDGLLDAADVWWDAENWATGSLGLASLPLTTTEANCTYTGSGSLGALSLFGLGTWELGSITLARSGLHTPNFGLDSTTGSACVPDVVSLVPNPYEYFAASTNGSVSARGRWWNNSACQTCFVHIDTDAAEMLVACPPGYDASAGEVLPATLAVPNVTWTFQANSASGVGPSSSRSVWPSSTVPGGWLYATMGGVRAITRGGGGVPVVAFHFPTLHLGRGTVVTTRGSYPLALVSRGSTVINTPLFVEPGDLGGFAPQLLPSPNHQLTAGPVCPHPVRDLLFTLLVTTQAAPESQQILTTVYDGQTLRGSWTASICVCTGSSCSGIKRLAACTITNAQSCTCPLGYAGRTTRRIAPLAEPDEVADTLNTDLGLALLAAGQTESLGALRRVSSAVAGVSVTRSSLLVRGGHIYNVTFNGIGGDVPLLTVTSDLTGRGAGVAVWLLSDGIQPSGNYALKWRGATTDPLTADASADVIKTALLSAFASIGLLDAQVTSVSVASPGDTCRWLESREERWRRDLGAVGGMTGHAASPSECVTLSLNRIGSAYSISLTARPASVEQYTAAVPSDSVLYTADTSKGSTGTPWPAFVGPSAAFGDVLSVQPAAGPSTPGMMAVILEDGLTVARVLPGHDAEVAARGGATSGTLLPAPAHKFSTLEAWRYFLSTADVSTCGKAEVAAASAAISSASDVPDGSVCSLIGAGLAESVIYPRPFWSFTSCRDGGYPPVARPAREPVDLLGGSAGAISAASIQELLARSPWAYLAGGIASGSSNATSWYAAMGPSGATVGYVAVTANVSLASAALTDPLAWVSPYAVSTASLYPPDRIDAGATVRIYSSQLSKAAAAAELASLRLSCGYTPDWQQWGGNASLAAVAQALAGNLTNASSSIIAGLPYVPPTVAVYLRWHARLAASRYNTTVSSQSALFRSLFNASFDDTAQPPSHDAYLPCCYGGAGGGAIAITAGGDITIGTEARISVAGQRGGDAPGGSGSKPAGGGGAGGTVALAAGGVVSVRGVIDVSGGPGGSVGGSPITGAAGAPGHILLYGQAVSIERSAQEQFTITSAGAPIRASLGNHVHVHAAVGDNGNYAVIGRDSLALDGLVSIPGRPQACPANASRTECTASCTSFGPLGALSAVTDSHAHGTLRALRVRSPSRYRSQNRFGPSLPPSHSGPTVVLPLRWDRTPGSMLPPEMTSGTLGTIAGYSAGTVWSSRGTVTATVMPASTEALNALWAAASSSNASGYLNLQRSVAAFSRAVGNVTVPIDDSLYEPRMRAALWSPACVRPADAYATNASSAYRASPFTPPAGCTLLTAALPRPDRISLRVRVEPPCGRRDSGGAFSAGGAGSLDSDDGREAQTSQASVPSHQWGAHIALHDDSALPEYQAWAVSGAGAWPPPAVTPDFTTVPWFDAANATAGLRPPNRTELLATLSSIFDVSTPSMRLQAAAVVGLLELVDSGLGLDNPCGEAAAALALTLNRSAMDDAWATSLICYPNSTGCACSNATAPYNLTWLGVTPSWFTRALAPGAGLPSSLGSSPTSGARGDGRGMGITRALSAPHPRDWIDSLPPLARDTLLRYYAVVDQVRHSLYASSGSVAAQAPQALYAALSAQDVMAGIAVLGAGSPHAAHSHSGSLSWRHGAAYRSSIPPWAIPADRVPSAGLEAEDRGGYAFAESLRVKAGLASCGGDQQPRRASNEWHKVDILLDWEAGTYHMRVDDVSVVADAPLLGAGVTRIGLYAVGGATAYFDELFAGKDDTLGFECPVTEDEGQGIRMDRPDQTHWTAQDAGPSTGAWEVTHHDSHVSRREMYAHSYHTGLVYYDGLAHTAYHSDVGPADAVPRSGPPGVGVSGSGVALTGANNSVPDLHMVPSNSTFQSWLAVAGPQQPAGASLAPPRRGSVTAGSLMWSPSDRRHYWYGEHHGPRFNASSLYVPPSVTALTSSSTALLTALADRDAGYYRRWYFAGGIGACSAVGHAGTDGSALRLWRNEGLVLRFANLSLPPGMQLIVQPDSFTSERPEDEAARLSNASLLPPPMNHTGPLAIDPAAPPTSYLPLRLERLKGLWNIAAEVARASCEAAGWGMLPSGSAGNCSSVTVAGAGNTTFGANATAPAQQPPGPFPLVGWAYLDGSGSDYRAAGVVGGLSPRGPLNFLRGLRPSGNATVDLTVLQVSTAASGSGNGSSAVTAAPAFLARSYFASSRFLMPAAVMQPLWESVKVGPISADVLALGPPSGVNASSNTSDPPGYWYPETYFALNYHRSYFDAGYDNPDDNLIQRWRREDQAWNVTAGDWRELWDGSADAFVLTNAATGEVKRYSATERAAVLTVTLDRHGYRHVYGQGRPAILSRYLDPLDLRHSAWTPSSVPAVRAQNWSVNYRDKNIADNAPHSTVPDLLIGEERLVQVRRASYVAVSRLSADYLSLQGEAVSPQDWDAAASGGLSSASATNRTHLRPTSRFEEIAVVEGSLEGLVGDGPAQGWLIDLLQGYVSPDPASDAASTGNATGPPTALFGWSSSPSDAGASTYEPDALAVAAPFGFETEPDWSDRHWQYVTTPGDRKHDFRNFRDRQVPGPLGASCPDLHHAALLKYAECQAILDGPSSAGPPPRITWTDGPTELDATLPTARPRAFSRGLDTAAFEACVSQHSIMLEAYEGCVRSAVPDFDRSLPDWDVGSRECVGGGGVCGPTQTAINDGSVTGISVPFTGGFSPFDPASTDASGVALCFALNGTVVPCASADAAPLRSEVRVPSARDLVAEDRAQKGWPPA